MVSSSPLPWYNVPPRLFPAQVWLEQRYPFRVPRLAFARVAANNPNDGVTPRPFPAKVWLEQRRQAQGPTERP